MSGRAQFGGSSLRKLPGRAVWRRRRPFGRPGAFASAAVAPLLLVSLLPMLSHPLFPHVSESSVKTPESIAAGPSATVTLTAPFAGGSSTYVYGGAAGCSKSYLQSWTPRFNTTTGVAKIAQRALASTRGCITYGIVNGSEGAGTNAVPFTVTSWNHSIAIDWRVVWTLNATSRTGAECTWWGLGALASDSSGSVSIAATGWSGPPIKDPPCLNPNGHWDKSERGLFTVYLNGSFTAGTWYLQTQIYIISGAFANPPGMGTGFENIASQGNYAKLLSIAIS